MTRCAPNGKAILDIEHYGKKNQTNRREFRHPEKRHQRRGHTGDFHKGRRPERENGQPVGRRVGKAGVYHPERVARLGTHQRQRKAGHQAR